MAIGYGCHINNWIANNNKSGRDEKLVVPIPSGYGYDDYSI